MAGSCVLIPLSSDCPEAGRRAVTLLPRGSDVACDWPGWPSRRGKEGHVHPKCCDFCDSGKRSRRGDLLILPDRPPRLGLFLRAIGSADQAIPPRTSLAESSVGWRRAEGCTCRGVVVVSFAPGARAAPTEPLSRRRRRQAARAARAGDRGARAALLRRLSTSLAPPTPTPTPSHTLLLRHPLLPYRALSLINMVATKTAAAPKAKANHPTFVDMIKVRRPVSRRPVTRGAKEWPPSHQHRPATTPLTPCHFGRRHPSMPPRACPWPSLTSPAVVLRPWRARARGVLVNREGRRDRPCRVGDPPDRTLPPSAAFHTSFDATERAMCSVGLPSIPPVESPRASLWRVVVRGSRGQRALSRERRGRDPGRPSSIGTRPTLSPSSTARHFPILRDRATGVDGTSPLPAVSRLWHGEVARGPSTVRIVSTGRISFSLRPSVPCLTPLTDRRRPLPPSLVLPRNRSASLSSPRRTPGTVPRGPRSRSQSSPSSFIARQPPRVPPS